MCYFSIKGIHLITSEMFKKLSKLGNIFLNMHRNITAAFIVLNSFQEKELFIRRAKFAYSQQI